MKIHCIHGQRLAERAIHIKVPQKPPGASPMKLEEKSTLMEPYQIVLLTLAVLIGVKLLALLILGKGSLARLGLAVRAFCRVMGDAALAERVRPLLEPAAVPEAKKPA